MEKILENYSLSDILLFLIIFAGFVKGAVDFLDWAKHRIKVVFGKEYSKKQKEQEVNDRLHRGDVFMHELSQDHKTLTDAVNQLTNKVDQLIESDKDDIKSFLTKEHHYFCYTMGWIDDFSLDCCERRFKHYEDEGGNSFIKDFMNDLRKLPKQPPHSFDK